MDLTNLMKMLSPYTDTDVEVYDLKTDEGLKKYNEALDQLEDASLDVLQTFGINGKEWIKGMRDLGEKLHKAGQKYEKKQLNTDDVIKKSVKQMNREVEDHTEEHDEEPKKEFKKPSELLTIQKKLQLHKIVQEYVDTMIKPFNNGILTNEQINDAYAGLYEFAAWIMNR